MERIGSVSPRTVVHLVPAMEQGGVETVVCDLNRALVRAGWRSVVVSKGGRLVGRLLADGGEHVALDLKSKNPLTALARAARLRRALRTIARTDARDGRDAREKWDARDKSDARDGRPRLLVCAHSRVPAWLFVLACQLDALLPHPQKNLPTLQALPFITYAHGANSVSRYSAVMTRGDRVIVPSRFLADFLVANYGAEREGVRDGKGAGDAGGLRSRIRVIHPAVDFARFDPAGVDALVVEGLRRAWGLAAGDYVVMAVGRLSPVKGLANVIEDFAARRGREMPSAARLVLVGGADRRHLAHEAELKALAASRGVADRVVFAGPQARVPECLSLADEVVSGNVTKPESFGLSVAEALAMNRPVRLLRRFGGAAEILDAVAAARRPTRREGVRALCDFDIMSRKTQAVYKELVR